MQKPIGVHFLETERFPGWPMTSIKDTVAVATGGSCDIRKAVMEALYEGGAAKLCAPARDPRAIGAVLVGAVDRQADAEIRLEHAALIAY
ncbi:hypothetical protein AB0L53_23130 [Nonomuraea sp. NPDC052129]|uniref:hypothetical protein n=1 Tax=Nonomuraea sp. NPDC052129 TaxID=3154651 RepID=UPI0034324BB5